MSVILVHLMLAASLQLRKASDGIICKVVHSKHVEFNLSVFCVRFISVVYSRLCLGCNDGSVSLSYLILAALMRYSVWVNTHARVPHFL